MKKAFFNIFEVASMWGTTPASIYAHLYRRNYDAVPPPIRLGRRLAWPAEELEAWIRRKTEAALSELPAQEKRPVGRPTKAESRARRQKIGLKAKD